MQLLPFYQTQYETEISIELISERLKLNTSEKDWDLNFGGLVNNRILEGKIDKDCFLVVMGKYGLTFGKFSLLPIMKGKMYYDCHRSKNIIKITVRPFIAGIFILSFFYLIAFVGIIFSIQQNNTKAIIILCIFFVVTYSSLIGKFNREKETYKKFIEGNILREMS